MLIDKQHVEYLTFLRKHHSNKEEVDVFEVMLEEVEILHQEHSEFFPGFGNVIKARVLEKLHKIQNEKTRNQVIMIDACWKIYTDFKKTRNFRAY